MARRYVLNIFLGMEVVKNWNIKTHIFKVTNFINTVVMYCKLQEENLKFSVAMNKNDNTNGLYHQIL
jgi:hypothetical protein